MIDLVCLRFQAQPQRQVDILSVGVNEVLWVRKRNGKRGEAMIIKKSSPGVGEVGEVGGDRREEEGGEEGWESQVIK